MFLKYTTFFLIEFFFKDYQGSKNEAWVLAQRTIYTRVALERFKLLTNRIFFQNCNEFPI